MRMRTIGLAAWALLGGCSVSKVHFFQCEGPQGTLELRVLRRADPDALKGGYSFFVSRGDAVVARFESSSEVPSVLTALAPGTYRVAVTGDKHREEVIDVKIKEGMRTTLLVLAYNARRNEHLEEAARLAGRIAVEAIYAIGWVLCECVETCIFGDDEDDVCHRPTAPPPPAKRFREYKKP